MFYIKEQNPAYRGSAFIFLLHKTIYLNRQNENNSVFAGRYMASVIQ